MFIREFGVLEIIIHSFFFFYGENQVSFLSSLSYGIIFFFFFLI